MGRSNNQGLQQPTISNNDEMIIFAGYSGIGWDLYSISNPNKLEHKVVQPTNFIKNKSPDGEKIVDLRRHKSVKNFEVIENCGHFSFLENPKRVAEIIA